MKKILFLLFFVSSPIFAGNWLTSFDDAQKIALATDKLILVDFWASWCAPCKKMDQESWGDQEVNQMMDAYVALRVDIDSDNIISNRYNVRSIPYVFIIDPQGQVLYKSRGYMDKAKVMEVLEEYALNTSFLKKENLSFYQHQNYITSMRLAQKYLDYSLFLDGNVKKDVLGVADQYLRKGKNMLERKQSNFKMMAQKIDLIDLNIDLYLENYNLVERQLEKYQSEEIDKNNKVLFAYLNYCISKVKGDLQGMTAWKEQMKTEESDIFLKKSELFLAAK